MLIYSSLAHANLDNAKFDRVGTTMVNFSFASMKNISISNEQLINASSIRGAMLLNGTALREDSSLLAEG